MHARTRQASLTEAISIRVTKAEREALEQRSEGARLTLSEWSRQVLVGSMETSPDCRLIVSELLGFRRLFLAIQVGFAQGKALTEETIGAAITEAERTKFEMADKRIAAFDDLTKKQPARSSGEINS